jgi:UDP-glucuronate 4-epimerase
MHGDGSSERDYTYITDALDGILSGLEWTGRAPPGSVERVNIGGGARVRLDRLIALIAAALGREAHIERHPEQPGDVRLTDADLAHAGRVLGFRPRVGIEEGIRHFVRWYEEIHGRQS